jgi:LPS-assembly lipoprotein
MSWSRARRLSMSLAPPPPLVGAGRGGGSRGPGRLWNPLPLLGCTERRDPPPCSSPTRGEETRRDDPRAIRRAKGSGALGVLAALTLAFGLAGCFQPLYSETAHPGLVEDLRAIEVAPIKDRIGHYLADNLTTNLNGTGQTPPPKYRLTVTVTTATGTPTVSSLTNVATSATLTGQATYVLNKVDGGAEVLRGVADANASYDRSQQRYNDLRAARDAEIRLARALSDEISLRLSAQLAGKTS